MTMPATSQPLETRLPLASEQAVANQLRTILASNSTLRFQGQPGEVVLTPALTAVMLELLRHIGSGDAVTIVPLSQMLTTQQAADILNVSRPYLIKLLETGALPYTLVGRHRRIRAEALFAYKQMRDAERKAALDELFEIDGELI